MTTLVPGPRRGAVAAPPSKSHAHRLLVANFLAGDRAGLADAACDSADVLATKRCLRALAADDPRPVLDCGESGSTLRFLAPVAAALGRAPEWVRRGRLAERPFMPYPTLAAGVHEIPGDVSSQFVTGLLFALPLLAGDSRIRFTSPLESRGYVEMTLAVLRGAGVDVAETADGYAVPGGQRYRAQSAAVEGDWSGAAFWLAMNALGSAVEVTGLRADSAQPDRAIVAMLARLADGGGSVSLDVSQCPDNFPALAVAAAAFPRRTTFTGIARLRLKECDRAAAMAETLAGFGVRAENGASEFVVHGVDGRFAGGGSLRSFGDHRVAMAAAAGATIADSPVSLDDAACAAKSYPGFFRLYGELREDGAALAI